MRYLPALLAALAPALASAELPPAPDRTARVELHGRTLFLSPEQAVSGVGDGWQALQFLEISGRDLARPGLSVRAALWGGGFFDAENRDGGGAAVGDVTLLYVGYADPKGRYELRLGRQLVLGGAAPGFYGQMDGGYGRASSGLLEVEAFGGRRVAHAFGDASGDYLGGARVGVRRTGFLSAGLSFTHASTSGRIGRQVAGADLTLRPLRWLDLAGTAAWDLVDPGVAEARAMVRTAPVDRLAVTFAVEQGSPGRLVDKSSIFSVFSLGDWAEGELGVEYAFTPQWLARGRYARVFFPDEGGAGLGGAANRFGAGVTTRPARSLWLTLDYDRLPSDDSGYDSLRMAGRFSPTADWAFTADLLGYFYDDAPLPTVSTTTRSLVAQLYAQRRLFEGFSVGVAGQVGSTVFSEVDFRGTLLATEDLDITSWGGR